MGKLEKFYVTEVTDINQDYGSSIQTIKHIVEECLRRLFSENMKKFHMVILEVIEWISNLDIQI